MRKYWIILVLLVTTGCNVTVHSWQFTQAAKVCKGYKNISIMVASTSNAEVVTCNNGRKYTLVSK